MVQAVDNQTDLQSVQDKISTGVLQAERDALEAAQQVKGTSPIEETADRVADRKELYGETGEATALGVISNTITGTFAGTAIAREVQVRAQNAMSAVRTDRPWQDIFTDVVQKSIWVDDPTWDINKNPHQRKMLEDIAAPYPETVKSAILRSGVYSLDLAMRTAENADAELLSQRYISGAGASLQTLSLATSAFDVDTLLGAGIFKAHKTAAKLKQIEDYVASGKLTPTVAAKIAEYSKSKGQSIMYGAVAGAEAALVAEGTNAALRPTVTTNDAINSMAVTAGIGAGLGSLGGTRLTVRERAELEVLRERRSSETKALGERSKQSRGERNNNPGNLDYSKRNDWVGQTGVEDAGRFATFKAPEYGIRALYKNILTYRDKYGLNNIRDIINRWAPTNENNTASYIDAVAKETGIDPDTALDLDDPTQAAQLVKAIIKHENGRVAYTDDTIIEGVLLAKSDAPDGVFDKVSSLFKRKRNSSVGAEGSDVASGDFAATTDRLWDEANEFFENDPDAYDAMFGDDGFDTNTAAGRMGALLYKGVNKTSLISDYQKAKDLPSLILKQDVYRMFTNPVGIGTNRNSADNLGGFYHESVAGQVVPYFNHYYTAWSKDRGIKYTDPRQMGEFFDKGIEKFNRELAQERLARYEGADTSHFSQHVRDFSDRIDAANELALKYGRDDIHGGRGAIHGLEGIEHKPGWFRRVWQSHMMNRVINAGKEAELVQAMAEGIMRRNDIEAEIAVEIAQAIKNTRLALETGTGKAELSGSEIEAVAEALQSKFPELPQEQLLDIVDRLFQASKDKKKPGYTKDRIDMDMMVPIKGTQYTLLDMIDTNILSTQERYYRSIANHAALAQNGIQKADIPSRKAAIMDEIRRNRNMSPEQYEATSKFIDDLYSMFGEGAYGGGTKVASRLNRLSRLSYLGGMMVTQIAESGVGAGIVGIKQYTKFMGKSLKEQVSGLQSADVRALAALNVQTDQSRLIKNLVAAEETTVGEGNDLVRLFDKWSNKGELALGILSGYNWLSKVQREVLARAVMHRAFSDAVNGVPVTQRWQSMGMSDTLQATLKKYVDSGDVKLNEDGDFVSANLDNWLEDDQLQFGLYLRSAINQGVQSSGRGETSHWMHNNELGALMMNLRSFVVTALQKQLIRNLRHADPELMTSILWTSVFAGAAYTARQVQNGQTDNLTPEKIALGAIGWGSITGPAVMFLDPLAHITGMSEIPGSPLPMNSWRYQQQGLIGLPGGLAAVNDLANIGRIPADFVVDGELDNTSIKALRAVPILGRSMAVAPLINALDEQ